LIFIRIDILPMKKILQIIALSLFITSWGWAQKTEKTDVLNKMIQSFPSPVEVSSIIKKAGLKYNDKLLNPADNKSKYKDDYTKALNLGIYSTDLGYINIYQNNQNAFSYLGAVKTMADGLNLGKHMDLGAITTLAFENNLNALLAETSGTFEKMNNDLWEQKKAELSALILTGGWLETLYLTCAVARQKPNAAKQFQIKELNEQIAQQKIILDRLLTVLDKYKKGKQMKKLVSDLKDLRKLFVNFKLKGGAQVKTQYKAQRMGKLNILVYSSQKQKTELKIDPKDLEKIYAKSKDIREKIIG